MKIIVVIPYFYPKVGGLENYAYNIVKGLHKHGVDVLVLTTNHESKTFVEDFVDGIRVIRLPYQFKLSNTPISFKWKRQIREIIEDEKPDLINAYMPVPYIADMAERARNDIPFVLSYANDLVKNGWMTGLLAKLYNFAYVKHTLRNSDSIIALSRYYIDNSTLLAPYKEKISVVSPGVDMKRFNIHVDKKWLKKKYPEKKIILFVGSMQKTHSHKGVDVLIRALAQSKSKFSNIKLVAVGGGDGITEYRELAKSLNVESMVDFLGFISDKILPKYFAGSDIFILPSISEAEGFGMVLSEAQACGTPVIATNIGGMPYIVENGRSGILVEPNDVGALSKAINKILSDGMPQKITKEASKKIKEKFTWEISVNECLSILQKTIANVDRKKVIDFTHYPILPANFGGAIRSVEINKFLSEIHSVKFYSLVFKPFRSKNTKIGNSEVTFFFRPLLSIFAITFWKFNIPYGFLFGFHHLLGPMPRYIRKDIDKSDLIIIEEPHLFRWVYDNFPNKKILLNEYNVEYDIESSNFSHSTKWLKNIVTKTTSRTEKFALEHADYITTVSSDDSRRINELYGIDRLSIRVIPNGFNKITDKDNLNPKLDDHLHSAIRGKKVVIFIGSEHKPNQEALSYIEDHIAPNLSEKKIIFLIVGNVGKEKHGLRKNIYYTGKVPNVAPYLSIASIAINPMESGAGSNLKLIEYLSVGIPTISTLFGARGTGLSNKELFICDIKDFSNQIIITLNAKTAAYKKANKGREFVNKYLDWNLIAREYSEFIGDCLK